MTTDDSDFEFREPSLEREERGELSAIARRLREERPIPRASFRGDLRRALAKAESASPRRVRLLVAAYAGSGLILLAVTAIGVAGAGPLAAG